MKFFRFEFGKKQIIQEYEMSAHNGSGHKRPHTDTGGSRKFLRLTVP